MTDSVPSSQRQRLLRAVGPRPRRSTPLRATWASPRSTRAPAAVRRRRVAAVTSPAGQVQLDQRHPGPGEPGQDAEAEQVGQERPRLPSPQPGEHRPGARLAALLGGGQERRSVRERPSRVEGTRGRAGRRPRRGSAAGASTAGRDLAQPARVGRPQRRPGGGPGRGPRRSAGWRPPAGRAARAQLAPPKWAMPRVLADADQPGRSGATGSPTRRIWASWSWS